MRSQESFPVLRNELLRRGLPPDYIERVTGELADHAEDMAAEVGRSEPTAATSAMPSHLAVRLGDPVRLADAITHEFQRRTFLGRHPWWTFVALPAGSMMAAWFAACLGIVLLVDLLLAMGGETPSDAWRWAAAVVAGTLAYGMTYGMPVLLCWWVLRKSRQTVRAWSWVWAATAVIVLTSFIFRLYVFRLDNGRFAIDSPVILRWGVSYLFYGETLPPGMTLGHVIRADSLSFGLLAEVMVLTGAIAIASRQSHRALAS